MVPSPVSNTGASQRLTSRQQGGYQYVSPPLLPPSCQKFTRWRCPWQWEMLSLELRPVSPGDGHLPKAVLFSSIHSTSLSLIIVWGHKEPGSKTPSASFIVVRDIKSAGRRAWEDPQNRPRWRCSSVVELLTGRSRTRNSFFLTVSTAILRPFPEHLLHPVWLSAGFSDLVLGYWILKHTG